MNPLTPTTPARRQLLHQRRWHTICKVAFLQRYTWFIWGTLLLFLCLLVPSVWEASQAKTLALPTWSTLIDHTVDIGVAGTTRSLRGIALTTDDTKLFNTWLQGSSGRQIHRYSATTVLPAMPELFVPVSDADNSTPGGVQARAIATDDRGNVFYVTGTVEGSGNTATPYIGITNGSLGAISKTAIGSGQFEGCAIRKVGGTYYLYVTRRGGGNDSLIQRFDVTNTAMVTLDATFGTGGTLDVSTLAGYVSTANNRLQGIEVAPDGTIFVAQSNSASFTDGRVYRIASSLASLSSVAVPGALDIALYLNTLFITQYLANNSQIAVLSAIDLSTIAGSPLTTGIAHPNTSSDTGYSGITVSSNGTLYVVDQLYSVVGNNQSDRVLVSNGMLPLAGCPTLTLLPPTIPPGKKGMAYSATFSVTGGTGPYTFTLTGGLPMGMMFAGDTLSGTPTQTGNFPITITVTDPANCSTSKNYNLIITGFTASISDPLICTGDNTTLNVHAELVNPNNGAAGFSLTAPIVAPLSGIPGTCVSSYGTCVVTSNSLTVTGAVPAQQTVVVDYKVQVPTGTPPGTNLCITSTGRLDVDNNGVFDTNDVVQACAAFNCPSPSARIAVSDQKPGSVLVFPYYTSSFAQQKDTRLTINNVGLQQAIVHVFFIAGTSCQQADQFVCLTPNASFSFKTSEYDPETTGWLLAVAVDGNGNPIQNNVLVGNAFVKDGDSVDDYGAESFAANSRSVAAISNDMATLYFDGVSYDAVPNQFAIGIQSPADAPNQRIVMAAMSGNLITGQLTGAAQVGTGLVFNEKETPFSSFNAWLIGTCQSQATITNNSPRVANGMSNLIKTGQTGIVKFNVGAAVGVLITPRPAVWKGIRTLHKTGQTASTLVIPIMRPVC